MTSPSPASVPTEEDVARARFAGLMLGQNPAEVWRAQAFKLADDLDAAELEAAEATERMEEVAREWSKMLTRAQEAEARAVTAEANFGVIAQENQELLDKLASTEAALAEKEREVVASIESHDAWAVSWNAKLDAAEARALSAEGERDAALLASRHETDLCRQALEDRAAARAALASAREALEHAERYLMSIGQGDGTDGARIRRAIEAIRTQETAP